jgi:hypothetical protein
LDPSLCLTHAPSGYRLVQPGDPLPRHLGVPLSSDLAAGQQAAYAKAAGAMRAAASRWDPFQLNLKGRAHVATACIDSRSTYLSCFMTPTLAQLQDMQQAVAAFVASTDRPDEETPYKSKLYPRSAVMALPVCKGGMALPVLQHSFAAMRAKSVWQALRFSQQPWVELFLHEAARARPAVLPPTFSGPSSFSR